MFKKFLLLLAPLFTVGCALAPGMYAGNLAPGSVIVAQNPETGEGIPVTVVPVTSKALGVLSRPRDTGLASPEPSIYKLGPGDVVNITVWEHPELTIPQGEFRSAEAAGNLIDEDGNLFYPYCGMIGASGYTRGQLRSQLKKCLARVIRKPQVDVRIIQYRSQRVYVGGAVNQPGMIPLSDIPVYAMDAVNLAGGLTLDANPRYATVTRDGKAFDIDLKHYTESGDANQNPLLKAGDTLHIRHAQDVRVNMLGEFTRPQSLPLGNGMETLADALAAASGLNPTAAEPSRILVMRARGNGNVVMWLDSSNPLQLAAAQRMPLEHGDVVYVDQTGLTRWNRVISQMLPGAVTSVGNSVAISQR